ncbi:class A sortase [Weissella confusa]|uniref:class A sortase n=1 Tax=Weissella confusa TaxID=1583 RepID=UPI001C6FA496|nr:class A sortase [Weissella confusa]QYU56716.1 class A sortase [Weissella confusa]QYU56827.1 class A sortase [Weissella confusa]
MPLHNEVKQTVVATKKRRPRWRKWVVVGGSVLALVTVSAVGYDMYNHHQVKEVSAAFQKQSKTTIAPTEKLKSVKNLAYGSQNNGIPNATQLKKYRNEPEKLYGRGYIAVPKQEGVTQPISSLPINEGASNKVLATGAGTPVAGEVMGEGNFSVAAHNFGNGVTYFSPMQKGIDVNKSPKAYLTDGKRLYTYKFNKTSDDVSGRKVVNYKQGDVLNDSVGHGKAILTMITCDEPGLFTLHPENRLLLRGHLIQSKPINQATASEKELFPQLFNA